MLDADIETRPLGTSQPPPVTGWVYDEHGNVVTDENGTPITPE